MPRQITLGVKTGSRIKRRPRPLRKTYDPSQPFVVVRIDEDDGSIRYEIMDERPDTYRIVCFVTEDCIDADGEGDGPGQAKRDAEMIARALDFLHGYKPL